MITCWFAAERIGVSPMRSYQEHFFHLQKLNKNGYVLSFQNEAKFKSKTFFHPFYGLVLLKLVQM